MHRGRGAALAPWFSITALALPWGVPGSAQADAGLCGLLGNSVTAVSCPGWEMCLVMRPDSCGAQELYLLKQCENLITASVTGHHLTLPLQPQPRLTAIIDLSDASCPGIKCPVKST